MQAFATTFHSSPLLFFYVNNMPYCRLAFGVVWATGATFLAGALPGIQCRATFWRHFFISFLLLRLPALPAAVVLRPQPPSFSAAVTYRSPMSPLAFVCVCVICYLSGGCVYGWRRAFVFLPSSRTTSGRRCLFCTFSICILICAPCCVQPSHSAFTFSLYPTMVTNHSNAFFFAGAVLFWTTWDAFPSVSRVWVDWTLGCLVVFCCVVGVLTTVPCMCNVMTFCCVCCGVATFVLFCAGWAFVDSVTVCLLAIVPYR